MFRIELSDSALEDLKVLRKTEQVLIFDSLETFLVHEPLDRDAPKEAPSLESDRFMGIEDRSLPGLLRR
jgi:hypothetical protein